MPTFPMISNLNPPFKSLLRLMFFSLFLLIVGQSSFAVNLVQDSQEHHFSHSSGGSSPSSPSPDSFSSTSNSPSLEQSPIMEGHAPAFSANDFFKHEFDSRDENEAVGGSVLGIHFRSEGKDGNGMNGNAQSSHGKDGKDASVVEGGNGVHSNQAPTQMGLGISDHTSHLWSRESHSIGPKPASSHHHHHHRPGKGRPSHLIPLPTSEKVEVEAEGLSKETETSLSAEKRNRHKHYRGKGTYFKPGMGACGHGNSASDLIVALPQSQYKQHHCGKYLSVCHQNKCVRVKVVDNCPSCDYGSLDLSPAAFRKLAPKSQGVIGISWSYTS